MDLEGSYKELHDNVTAALVSATRTAGQIASEDLSFLRSSNPMLGKALNRHSARLLSLARSLTKAASDGTGLRAPRLSRADDVNDQWRGVVDVVDSMLEKADICLDEYTGIIKKQITSDRPVADTVKPPGFSSRPSQNRIIPKPQLFFRNIPKNNETTAFKPLLRSKPHARKPLEESIRPVPSTGDSHEYDSIQPQQSSMQSSVDSPLKFSHPYETEIQQYKYPSAMYTQREPIPPRPFQSTTATYVDTLPGVHEMLLELKEAREIAIDLEHHEVRSYIGIVSLMQISTRDKDWIVDTLKPWREDLQVLNEVFADPKIVKVLHGAAMDIIWLQRDLGLYVVGLFDTFHAASALGYPKRSLAALLKKFVDFDAQKQFQLADWRTRPLTDEMFEYARSDTHFLHFVYDNLRNELLQKSSEDGNLLDTVLEESKNTALQRYERPFYDFDQGLGYNGWYYMLIRNSAVFTKEQFSVFKFVHRWRDEVARKEDESVHYVMQSNTLYSIAREMPTEVLQLLGCMSHVSDPVRKRISELLGVIARAKANGANGPDMKDTLLKHPATIEYEARKITRRKERVHVLQPSLAEIARRENLQVSGEGLVAGVSSFWGSIVDDLKHQRMAAVEAMQIPLQCSFQIPLPNLTAEVFATDGSAQFPGTGTKHELLPQVAQAAQSNEIEEAPPSNDEIFTIRERGGPKRKREVEGLGPGKGDIADIEATSEEDEMKLDQAEAVQGNESSLGKRSRRRNKKLPTNSVGEGIKSSGTQNGFEPDPNPEGPFDYGTAPSVLHAKPNLATSAPGPVFDPYKKLLDAPKGLGRARRETAGRSATFKK